MTTENPLSPKVALHDVKWYVENPPSNEYGDAELLAAAARLAKAIDDVLSLETSRIGASEYLANFDGGDFDNYSFYQGVSFALAKVGQILSPREPSEASDD
jgi:hypothetical protein